MAGKEKKEILSTDKTKLSDTKRDFSNLKKCLFVIVITLGMAVTIVSAIPSSVIEVIKHVGISGQIGGNDSGRLLKVHFLNVGHGDSILIQLGNYNMLIDTGTKEYSENLIQYLKKQEVDEIDALVLTHAHGDHMGGAVNIINSFKINVIYVTDDFIARNFDKELIDLILEKQKKVLQVKAGDEINTNTKLQVEVISPAKEYEKINDTSMVLYMTYFDNTFLFTGDISKTVENDILNSGYYIASDVLKVSHHGIEGSTSEKFLQAVDPKYVVISSWDKFPNESVLKRIRTVTDNIFITKENGTIIFCSDGEYLTYQFRK